MSKHISLTKVALTCLQILIIAVKYIDSKTSHLQTKLLSKSIFKIPSY